MLSIALSTLRTRWHSLTGTFVALALGVAMTAAMGLVLAATVDPSGRPGPRRFGAAAAVVVPDQTLTVTTAKGAESRPLAEPRGLTGALAAKVTGTGPAVPDRSFYAHVAGNGPSSVGHPWPIARFGGYRLTAGAAPRTDGEIVVGRDTPARPGDRVTVLTRTGQKPYTVSGVAAAPSGFEHPVFFSAGEAARLAPRIDALAAEGPPSAVRSVVNAGEGKVLTGDDRRQADPDPGRDRRALNNTNVLIGIAVGIAGFVAIFVVASTFALAVAQRRRELALMRAIGATPRQVRRMLLAEALLIGLAASTVGCALAPPAATLLASWLSDHDLAPSWFTVGVSPWPLLLAFGTGLLVALAGVFAASRRAGRIRPSEALRETRVERKAMGLGRWLLGLAVLGGGLTTMAATVASGPAEATNRKGYTPTIMMLITGFALLAPVLVPTLTRLLTWPLSRSRGAAVLLMRENTLVAVRRTAAVAAPILITVGLAGSLLGASYTIDATRSAELRHRARADFIVQPAGGGAISDVALARVRAVAGADAVASGQTTVYAVGDADKLYRFETQVMRADELAKATRLPLESGSLTGLSDDSIIVNEDWGRAPGDRVDLWLADGTKTSARVAAVVKSGFEDGGVYLAAARAGQVPTGRIDVMVRPGADHKTVERALRTATTGLGVETVAAAASDEITGKHGRTSWLGILVTLGIALSYCGISIANTLAMAAADRARDQSLLRLTGATALQVLAVATGEAALVVCLGVVLAVGVSVLSMAGIWMALNSLSDVVSLDVPWLALGGITAVCALIAVLAMLIPTIGVLRTQASTAAALRD